MNDWIPAPTSMSDKLVDWQTLAAAGGQTLLIDKDVVDAGPAWGVDALWMSPWARRYVALDSSARVLDHLRRHMPKTVEIVESDLTMCWAVEPASFDLVLDFSSFDDSVDAPACYAQAARALRPGGVLVSTFGNSNVIKDPRTYCAKQDPAEVVRVLRSVGLEISLLVGEHDRARAGVVGRKR